MVTHSKGPRRKSRKKLRQRAGYRPTITKFLQEFKVNEKVVIDIEPSSQKGMPALRFQGRVAEVVGKRGRAYVLKLKDGGKEKTLIVRPEHLKRVSS